MISLGGTTTHKVLLPKGDERFCKVNLTKDPMLVITEHYNEVSEYFTVHVELLLSINKRNFLGIKMQKHYMGSGSIYFERDQDVLKQSVDLGELSSLDSAVRDSLAAEIYKVMQEALERHKHSPAHNLNTLNHMGAI